MHWSFPEAVSPRVRSLSVIGVHPAVKIFLQLLYRRVYLLSERNGIELVLYRSVEAFTDAVRLWAFRLDFGVVDVLNGQIQFIFMCFPVATVFSSPVSEHPHEFQVMLLEEGYHTVIEHVRRHERILSVIQLGKTDFGIGVDYRLLVNVPSPRTTACSMCSSKRFFIKGFYGRFSVRPVLHLARVVP